MIVRFAEICDHCGKRSEEYSRKPGPDYELQGKEF